MILLRPLAVLIAGATLTSAHKEQTDTTLMYDSSLQSTRLLASRSLSDNATWADTTNEACLRALARLPRATNPSGTCLCYNLPSLHVDSGEFEAEVRLFNVSSPRYRWAHADLKAIDVSVKYPHAEVTAQKMDEEKGGDADEGPVLMQVQMLSGKINQDKLTRDISIAALQTLLMPNVTISSYYNDSASKLYTSPSTNEAVFLTGVFSQSIVLSDFAAASRAAEQAHEGVQNGTVPLVLPGQHMMLFPIGLVITGVWTVIGVLVIGFGTWERMGFVDVYKRGKRREELRAAAAESQRGGSG